MMSKGTEKLDGRRRFEIHLAGWRRDSEAFPSGVRRENLKQSGWACCRWLEESCWSRSRGAAKAGLCGRGDSLSLGCRCLLHWWEIVTALEKSRVSVAAEALKDPSEGWKILTFHLVAAGFIKYLKSKTPLKVQPSRNFDPANILVLGAPIPVTFQEIPRYSNFESSCPVFQQGNWIQRGWN